MSSRPQKLYAAKMPSGTTAKSSNHASIGANNNHARHPARRDPDFADDLDISACTGLVSRWRS